MDKAIFFFSRGYAEDLQNRPLQDGLLAFTVDDGRIYADYTNKNNELVRATFYPGELHIGSHVFNGTKDVYVGEYEGNFDVS